MTHGEHGIEEHHPSRGDLGARGSGLGVHQAKVIRHPTDLVEYVYIAILNKDVQEYM